ncbi:hypothetical protein BCT30_10740 [Enterovibrio norvegicus]|uniref:Uncharacterized protein n=2 Tax=Enterovibrio norvegicus TaxID=188144 RepID=A0A1I5T4T6_9GAMM|nr:hypothetical protein [Enterovibrio norvegicus]MCC4799066.1 hypothetical protein [Enterovibrio norvegicus]OEE43179.1 hypothetical protein A1OS_01680 [Enterovibrio norvegicus]OEF48828.1 hypothetical protein A1OW_14000 [Enterovibrio norvegicus]OEF53831.1 hypothetical protein A1OU_01685 [Enterovibrio norvegicus]PMI41793.1 hypothetical protein BCU46_00095 [Enterovibrio norvegicus]
MAKVFCTPDKYSENFSAPAVYLGDETWSKIQNLQKTNLGALSVFTQKVENEDSFSASFGSLFSASYDSDKTFLTICCTVSESFANPVRHDGPDAIQFGYGFYVGLVVDDKDFNCDGFGSIRANISDHSFTSEIQFIGLNTFFSNNAAAKLCQSILLDGTAGGDNALDNLVVGSTNLMKLLNDAQDGDVKIDVVSYSERTEDK